MTIDFHFHYTPKGLVDKYGGSGALSYYQGMPVSIFQPKMYQISEHIEAMDMADIERAVISSQAALFSTPFEDCVLVNNEIARIVDKHPDRFLGLAHVPPLGGQKSLKELERCIKKLGFVGVMLPSDVDEKTALDSQDLHPLLSTICDLDAYVFVHSSGKSILDPRLKDYDMSRSVGREFGLCMAVIRLINGGVLERFPSLRVLVAHMGGALPSLLPRIRKYQDRKLWGTDKDPVLGKLPELPFDALLSRLYFDTGGAISVRAALAEIDDGQCVFGSDYPLDFTTGSELREFCASLRKLKIKKDLFDTFSQNAKRLLGRNKTP